MDDRRPSSPVMVGASSLLVIFAVLCLTVFALLSISTSRANRTLSDRTAQAVEGYYAADCRAEEILARLRGGEAVDGVEHQGSVYTYTCPISESQLLCVQVRLEGAEYTVLRWQAISALRWEQDDSLHLWDGEGT